jgi:hypothetical protein
LTLVSGASVEVLAIMSLVGPWGETPLHCVVDLRVGQSLCVGLEADGVVV